MKQDLVELEAPYVLPHKVSRISNILNLLSTFLFLTNYYIVAPSSGRYASKLGGNEALAGLIIGMTPIAALASTILYSWWTSHSYKAALIFASTCSIVGNILYALGLPCNSILLVMVGRLLTGFGSVRSINRRYIADCFSRDERTAAFAAFVTAGALGMVAGPALAAILDLVTPENNIFWSAENAPGWIMCVIWSIYLILLVLKFQDPPRNGDTPKSTDVEITGEKEALLSKLRVNRIVIDACFIAIAYSTPPSIITTQAMTLGEPVLAWVDVLCKDHFRQGKICIKVALHQLQQFRGC